MNITYWKDFVAFAVRYMKEHMQTVPQSPELVTEGKNFFYLLFGFFFK